MRRFYISDTVLTQLSLRTVELPVTRASPGASSRTWSPPPGWPDPARRPRRDTPPRLHRLDPPMDRIGPRHVKTSSTSNATKATTQLTEQIKGSWQERSDLQMLLEEWIDLWVAMLGDIEPHHPGQVQVLRGGPHPARVPGAPARFADVCKPLNSRDGRIRTGGLLLPN